MDGLSEAVDETMSSYAVLQDNVQKDKSATEDLVARGKAAQQVVKDGGRTEGKH